MKMGPLAVYPALAALAVGWLLGRAPTLLGEMKGLAVPAVAAAMPPRARAAPAAPAMRADASRTAPDAFHDAAARDAERMGLLVGAVAAEAAARAAHATVDRLIAAGWGPPLPRSGGRPASPAARRERGEGPPAWSLPPAAPAGMAAATPRPASAAVGVSGASPAPRPAQPAADRAHAMATGAYADLRRGERRAAAAGLRAALAEHGDAPQGAAWRAELRRLERRWTAEAWLLARDAGGEPLAAAPVLGGGQFGALVGFTPAPLAKRPLTLFARYAGSRGALDGGFGEQAYDLGAAGLRWQALPQVAVDVERRFALGVLARDGWSARLSGGAQGARRAAGLPIGWDMFAEAGGVLNDAGVGGPRGAAWYGGGQARVGAPVRLGRLAVDAGLGVWGSAQHEGGSTAARLDVGPAVRLRVGRFPVTTQIDYRLRAAGNALPASGPAVTVVGRF